MFYQERKLLPVFDVVYEGFASGSLEEDAFGVRQFVSDGNQAMFSYSYAKNFGLYGWFRLHFGFEMGMVHVHTCRQI